MKDKKEDDYQKQLKSIIHLTEEYNYVTCYGDECPGCIHCCGDDYEDEENNV